MRRKWHFLSRQIYNKKAESGRLNLREFNEIWLKRGSQTRRVLVEQIDTHMVRSTQ
jgi:hypothetical protein